MVSPERTQVKNIADSESLGGMLKRARELRGISLEEVAAVTHVQLKYLKAIEQNQLNQLPGMVFLKGYVRAYVNYVGLNLDEVMSFLDNYTGPSEVSRVILPEKYAKLFLVTGVFLLLIFLIFWVFKKIL